MRRSILAMCYTAPLIVSSQALFAYDLMPLWESRHVANTATFYTTYLNDHKVALNLEGQEDHGVAAWVACSNNSLNGPNGEISYKGQQGYEDTPSGDWITPSRFRHGYTAAMDFPCLQPSGALPLYSMYKPAPQTDYIYTTSVTEFNAKKADGYGFGRVEGYVFTSQVAGSAPFYRLSTGTTISNHDAEHRYTISANARQSLINAGWLDEGITGYVFPSDLTNSVGATQFTGTYNGYNISPTTTVNVPIRNVVPTTGSLIIGGNSASVQYGMYASNVTARPASAVWQNITFDFYTGDVFNPGTTLDHMPIFLHYSSTAGRTQLSAIPPYDGIALMLVPGNTLNGVTCGAPANGGQLFFEIVQSIGISCAPNLSSAMQANTWYNISYSLDDAANVRVNVKNATTGAPVLFYNGASTFTASLLSYFSCPLSYAFGAIPSDKTYCVNPFSLKGFPVNNTGYFWIPAFRSNSNTTARMNNTTVKWLNSSFVPLN